MPADPDQAFWWLLAIARRTVANHRRGLIRRTALADRLRVLPVVTELAEESEATSALREAMELLNADDQELVRLVYWDGLSITAAASVLLVSDAAARKRMQRVRRRLLVELEDRDVVTSASTPRAHSR
jgi:RNA polymerase sigma-70 factor (ECF subfamily)